MKIETRQIAISKLHPNNGQLENNGIPKNPRFIRDGKYKKLIQSIKDDPEMLSLRELIAIDSGDEKTGYIIIGGNMRYRAMKELGYKEAPTKILPSDFPVDKARRIILKDNASFGETDFDALLSDWSIEDISSAAIDIPDIDDPHMEEAEDAEEDNFDVAGNIPKVAQAKDGDIYRLGEHRLICGDSTKQEYINALMDGDMADLLVTDPPYNVDYHAKGGLNKIANDNMADSNFIAFLTDAFTCANNAMRAGLRFIYGMQILKGWVLEPQPQPQAGLSVNVLFGTKIRWYWEDKTTNGSTNHACTDGKTVQRITSLTSVTSSP